MAWSGVLPGAGGTRTVLCMCSSNRQSPSSHLYMAAACEKGTATGCVILSTEKAHCFHPSPSPISSFSFSHLNSLRALTALFPGQLLSLWDGLAVCGQTHAHM